MAFQIYQVPLVDFNLARSPLIVTAGDPLETDPNYRVIIKVYAWLGDEADVPTDPTVKLDKVQLPSPLGFAAKFNIAPILEDLFIPNDPNEVDGMAAAGDGLCYNYVLEIGYEIGGVETIDTTTTVAKAVSGYSLYPDDINDYDNREDYEESAIFTTVRYRRGRVVCEQPAWLSLFWQGEAASSSDAVSYIGTDMGGTPTVVNVDISDGGGVLPKDSANFLVRARIDSDYVSSLGFDITKQMTIRPNFDNDPFVFTYTKPLCLVGADTIGFINRFGQWDFLHVYASQRKGIETNRIEYKSRVAQYDEFDRVTYDIYNPSQKILRSTGQETYEVSTGWMYEENNDLIRDLFLSKIWYSFNEGKAIILVDKQIQYKYEFEEQLINYTLRFKVANSVIQDIQ